MIKDTVEVTEEQLNSIRDAFKHFDSRGNGHIPTEKLGEVMRGLGHDLRREQLRELEKEVDTDGNGTIEWEEFLPLVAAKLKEKEEQAFYKNLFRMLDKQNNGFITCVDLKYILNGLAAEVGLTATEVGDMVDDIDEDGNGEVSFEEFYKLMTTE